MSAPVCSRAMKVTLVAPLTALAVPSLVLALLYALSIPLAAQSYRTNEQIASDLERIAAELRAKPEPVPTMDVASGGSISEAITALATTGGVVKLLPGVTYYGPIHIPARAADAPLITITTSGVLPDRRITPADAPLLATIAAVDTLGAFRIINTAGVLIDGVRLTMTASTHEVVVIQNSDNITLDRVLYCPGDATCVYNSAQNVKRVVRFNGRHLKVTRSYLNAGPRQYQDNQAILGWEGRGPYTVTDNTLMAGGENIIFGGASNSGPETNPADILIDNNYLFKPQEWRNFPGSVKNNFEIKNGTRVVFSNNIIDGCWKDAQPGFAIVLTPADQDGRNPGTAMKDVLIERNVIRNTLGGVNIIGYGYTHQTEQSSGIVIRKNVFEISGGKFAQMGGEIADVTLEDNVVDNTSTILYLYEGSIRLADGTTRKAPIAVQTLNWNRNVQRDNGYGIMSEVGTATAALTNRTAGYTFLLNQFTGLRYKYPEATLIDEATFLAAKAALLNEIGR